MKLRVKCLDLSAGGKTIALINNEDAREFGISALDRLVLRKKHKKITALVNVTSKLVPEGEIWVYSEIKKILGLKTGALIDVEPREELVSKQYIRRKIDGGELNQKEFLAIVKDVVARNLNDLELASFITALHIRGLSLNESIAMSKAMISTSKKIKFHGTICDKHSVGGIPGDKTSMLLVPIIASLGLTIPKTSSRSILSPAGTADRMEALAPVIHSVAEIKKIVKRTNGCLVWGGSVDLAPADDLFIQIEHPLALDPLLLPSVMSKKKVAGSKFLIVDIPVGPEAKLRNKEEAEKLANDFIALGKALGIKVDCAITRGDQPLGHAMGPALEAREVLETLMKVKENPDLIDKVTSLAGILLSMVGKGSKELAKEILDNGKAEAKLREIIKAQGGNPNIKPEDIPYAKYKFVLKSKESGIINAVSNKILVSICMAAGTPKDKLAGIYLNKKIGDFVKRGEVLFTIYSEKQNKLKRAVRILQEKENEIFIILDHKKKKMLIEKI